MTATTQIMEQLYNPQGPVRDPDIQKAMRSPHHTLLRGSVEHNIVTVVKTRIAIKLGQLAQLRRYLLKKKIKAIRRALAKERRRLRHRLRISLALDEDVRAEIERAKKEVEARIRKMRSLENKIDFHEKRILELCNDIAETKESLAVLDREEIAIMDAIDDVFANNTRVMLASLREELMADPKPAHIAIQSRVDDDSINWQNPGVKAVAEQLHAAITAQDDAFLQPLLANEAQLATYRELCQQQAEALRTAYENGDTIPHATFVPDQVLNQQLRQQMSFAQEVRMVGKMRHMLAPAMQRAEAKAHEKLQSLADQMALAPHGPDRDQLVEQHAEQKQLLAQHRGYGGIRGVGLACKMGVCLAKPYRKQQAEEALETCQLRLADNYQQRYQALQQLEGLEQCLQQEHQALNECQEQLRLCRLENKELVEKIEQLERPRVSNSII